MQILKKITMLAFLLSAFAVGAMAQLTGTKNIPGDYATVALAVTDLNTNGVGAGGVTFVVADGYAETAPAGGYTITNLTGNGAGNPIVFRRATSSGTRPMFTANAALTAGSLTDAIFKIVGTDNLTIDGFQMLENPGNLTTTAASNNMTEFGVALFYATTTNGSQNVTVQNCIITLNRTYQNTFGIYSNSTHSATAVTTTASATTTDGGNSGLKLYGNSISNVNIGIVVVGPTAVADHNEGLDIGGTAAATGNSVTNYGTTGTFSSYANVSGTVNGVLVRFTRNYNVSFNSIISSVGGTTAGTLRGIYVPTFTTAPTGTLTNSINNNNISVQSGVLAGTLQGIVVEATTASTTSTLNINNNDFSASGHTIAAASGTITFISNAAVVQNENINTNTFTNMSVNTTGSVTFITNTTTNAVIGGIKNVNGNSIVTAFAKTGAGGTVTLFTDDGSDVAGAFNNSNNNNFSNITVTGAAIILGLSNTNGGSPTKTVTGNTLSNWTGGTGATTAMVVSFSGTATVSNNSINTITGGGSVTGISSASGGSVAADNFSQNTVHTLTGSGTGAVTGMLNSSGTLRNFFRNRVYNLSNTNAGGTVSGLTVSSGTTINVYNNLIGDVRAPALNATNSLFGINISGGTTVNADFNTVYLNATSTGANFGSSALNASSTPTFTMRNNILVNTSTAAGTGLTAAYRRSSTTLTTYGSASNNNDFFAGTPSATSVIFTDGTNSDQTLAAYKSRVTPRDAASITENPNFISTTGSNANFLHISTATPTQLESGGIPVTYPTTPPQTITDDFDGQTRNATTPDIGADEFTGTAIDLNPPVISYTAPGNTTSTTNRVITATITDPSGVAGSTNSPRIYFRKNGGAYTSTQCAGSSPTYTCTIDYSAVGGIAANDVIDYFIVAQDTNGNVGANPSGGFAGTSVNNVTSFPTAPNTYTVVAGFPTSVNVGATETTTSLTNTGGVFAALNAGVLTGNVTINITSDLTAETGTVALNQLNEEGAGGYTVTIQSSGATARTISGSNATALINLNGADRINFNGAAFGANGLTIRNTSATTGAVVQMLNDASNNTITSCVIEGGNTNASSALILLGAGTTTGNDNNAITNSIVRDRTDAAGVPANLIASLNGSATARNSNNTVTGNQLINFTSNGFATSSGATSENWTISGNDISQTATRAAAIFGINTGGMAGTNTISGNSIHGFVSSGANAILGFLVGNSLNTTISRNRVYDFQTTAAATGLIEGLEFDGASGGATNLTVVNNMISLAPTLATAQIVIGIQDFGFGGNTFTADFNSVYIGGTATGATPSWAIRRGTAAPTTYTARNNIAFNGRTGGTSSHFAGGDQSANTGTFVSNYNLFVGTGATPANFMDYGTSSTGTPVSFAVWQAGPPARDANSLASVAGVGDYTAANIFVSTATELRLNTTGNNPAIGAGIPITGITTDFDGQTRDTPPDIGADEIVNFVAPTVQFSGATYMGAEGTSATVTVTRTGDLTVASTVNYATSDGTATGGVACVGATDYQSASGTLNFAAGEMNKTFTVTLCSDVVVKGSETVNLTLSAPTGATLGAQSAAVLTITNVAPPMPGTLALNAATYSISEAGGSLTVTVNRTGGTDGAVAVNYTLGGGTATGGAACGGAVDYVNAGGTVNFAAGEAVKTFTVAICNDTALEGNETFNVTLSGATGGATLGTPSTAVATILDDEVAQPGVLQFNPAGYTVGEAGPTVTLTVTRTGGTDGAVGASYSFANGTATGGATCAAGVDFVNTGGTISFAAGETSKTIVVTICNDTLLEGNEAFTATLATPTGGATLGAAATATVTITDDEVAQPGTLQFNPTAYTVGEAGTTVTLTVTRTGGTDGAVGASYSLANGTATGGATCAAGVDFVNAGGTVSFANGEASKTIVVTICNDTVLEGNEAFTATLAAPTGGATLGAATATVTILDDEVAQNGTVQFAQAFYTVSEGGGSVTLTVTRTGGSDGAVSVNYSFAGGTASGAGTCAAGIDYAAVSGTLNWASGDSTPKTFNVSICEDTLVEGNENFLSFLQTPTGGATVGTQSSTDVTITDNDAAPTGNVIVNPGNIAYATLKEAFDAINAGTHTGAVTVDIAGNTTETASATLNASGSGAASYTSVVITPSGGARVVEGAIVGAVIKLNGADNVTIDGRIGGAGRNLTVRNTSTVTATAAIWLSSVAAGNGASNNVIRNLEIAAGATSNVNALTTIGVLMNGATVSVTADGNDNDNNQFIANRITKARYGIVSRGVATNVNEGLVITDNIVGPTAFGADQIGKAGIFLQFDTGAQVSRNTVQYVGGDFAGTTAGSDRCGICIGGESWGQTEAGALAGGDYSVTKNIVHDVVEERTFSAVGIRLGTTRTGLATNNLVANNFIYNVRANATAGDQVVGIGYSGGNTDRIVFNSISLTGDMDPTAAVASTIYGNAMRVSTVNGTNNANLTMMNNSIYLDVNSNTATNRYFTITLPAATYTFGTGGLNYNNYYFNPANSQLRTGGVGVTSGNSPGTEFLTLADWRTALTPPQDANSIQADPFYISNTGDLHIQPTSLNESRGISIAGVTDDIDGNPRPATPDIGADEISVSGAGVVQFSSTNFSGTEGTTATISVIRSAGTDGTVGVTATVTNGTATGGAACGAGVDFINPGPQTLTFGPGVATQTFTIQLCTDAVLESSEAVNLTLSNPTGGATIGANNPATLTIIDVPPPLSGTINVGTGETFTSLTNPGGVFQTINGAGLSANLTINITSDLTAETGAVSLNQFTETGAGGYTLTFKPSGAARTVSGTAAALSMIKLNGADRVTFDGSLSGGTDRSLTFLYTNTGGTVFWIASANTTNGSNNNTIKNCIIASNPATVSVAGILAGSGTTLGGAAESPNSNNTVQNNQVFRVQNSMFIAGNATNFDLNWSITNNEFGSTTTADKNSFRGMLIRDSQNFMIAGNTVRGIQSAATTTAAMSGIQLAGLLNGGTVVKNRLSDIKNVSTTGTGAYGINIGATSTASNVTIANNFVSDVAATGSATINSNGFGIAFLGSGTGYNVYYNSVNLNTDQTTAQTTAALLVNSTFATAGALDVRNNIFANTQTTGTRYAVYSLAAATVFTTINYNDYFAQNVGFIGGTARPTLADWQTGTGQDANSKAVDPLFVSATDLHLQATSPVLDMGTPIAGITDDIDGQTRSTTTPDIGADEVTAAPQNGSLALSASTYTVSEAATSLTVTVNRTGGTTGAVAVNYTLGGGTATGGAACAAGIDYINTGGTVNFADGQASQTFTVTLCPDTLNKANETFNVTLSGATGGAIIGTPATAVVTITNDDPTPTIAINDVSLNEGNSGTTSFVFTVSLSAASGQTVTVNYSTADGTATAGSDYTAIPNTVLTFAPGETTKSVTVLVNGDTTPEANETFNVNLATPTNATIADPQGLGTIVNDDAALPSLAINDVRVVEGNSGTVNAVFTVTLSQASATAVSVAYATANGTATAGSDYVATSGTLNFAAGQTTQTITVVVNGDTLKEANETFFVNLSGASGAAIGDNQGLGIIIDDDRAIPADFDKDRKTDYSVFRPSNGYWYVLQSSNNLFNPMFFGQNGDLPVPGDYDGDGATDFAVFRPSNGFWYVQRSSDFAVVSTLFGFGTDKPVQGDYDGDGKTDIAVFRPSNGAWYILQSSTGNQFTSVNFGISTDVPVQGDYDGDAKTDVAVYRNGVWYVLNSSNSAVTAVTFGASTDKPLVGDFDGDGKADYTVYRAGIWYIFQTQTNTPRAVAFGAATDIPVVGDYDRDGTSDIAVFRPSNGYWYVLQSSNNGFTAVPFGQQGDIPIPTGYQSLQ